MSDKKRSRTACNGKEATDDVIDAVKTAIDGFATKERNAFANLRLDRDKWRRQSASLIALLDANNIPIPQGVLEDGCGRRSLRKHGFNNAQMMIVIVDI